MLGTSYFVYQIVPYIVANYQYEQLVEKEGLSKQRVEDLLFLYSSREIPIKDSLWGKNFALENGDICWQYLILCIIINRKSVIFLLHMSKKNKIKRGRIYFPSFLLRSSGKGKEWGLKRMKRMGSGLEMPVFVLHSSGKLRAGAGITSEH